MGACTEVIAQQQLQPHSNWSNSHFKHGLATNTTQCFTHSAGDCYSKTKLKIALTRKSIKVLLLKGLKQLMVMFP